MFTWSKATQAPLVTVQRKVFTPGESPLTPVAGFDASAKVPLPETTLQAPIPTVAGKAARVALSAHTS